MKFLKLSLAAVFALAMTAGALMAADEPLEIHGGGRIGFQVNSMLGSNGYGPSNRMGRYPNHAETNYYCLWFSKKVTGDNGAWSKSTFGLDNWNATPSGDLAAMAWRLRGFNVEFGGLDFLPAGSTVKAGLFGLSIGWNDAMDFGPGPNFSGIGIGITNLGGAVGLYYMAGDSTDGATQPKLGERTMHTLVATVSNPMVDVIGGFGYAKKADNVGEKNLTAFAAGAVAKLPVGGLNAFAQFGTNNFAMQMEDGNADDTVLKNTDYAPSTVDQTKKYKATIVKVGFYSIMDIAEGLNVAPALFYQYYKIGKENMNIPAGVTDDLASNKIYGTVRISKALTKNLAFVPALGYGRTWTDAEGDKAAQTIQATAGLCMALDTGYWAGQKIQVYGTFINVDKDHKATDSNNDGIADDGFDGKANRFFFGTYVTFGF